MATPRKGPPRRTRARPRDREATRAAILFAVRRILSTGGFQGLGVNAVAAAAGVDKVLIYRYFGGLPELLAAFAGQAEFWPHEDELLREGLPASIPAAAVLKGLLRALRKRPMTQAVLRWELSASNKLVGKLAAVREEQGLRMLRRLQTGVKAGRGIDLPAVAAVLSAGITYLVLRSTSGESWLGVSLQGEAGWRRLEAAIDWIVNGLLEHRTGADRRRADSL